ncbi:hypothetical protein CONLIGDRAFT_685429 [Coniochaeta ligniaria NRRL 30616]|uniref:Uncharacterized protein n=1 Tax=Coniochaeta ligniaria NRRL 30616 TaxID=1408157 RepID=A0A1J7I9V0_9PEZI|nr:hypothetical protein CONLIGDRAFT_685429 [Coniochaeta ligniaria NRRL 30616]
MATPSPPAEQSQRPLNPEMVYRPLTPRSTDQLLGNDDDNDPPSYKIPITVVPVLRVLVAILASIDWILWAGQMNVADVFMILIFIELLFLFIWTLFLIAYKRSVLEHLCPGGGTSCQLGPLRCILGYPEDDHDGDEPPKKKKPLRLSWIVDLYFAVSLLVFSLVSHTWEWNRVWRIYQHIMVLLYFVVAFEFIIAIATFLSIVLKTKSVAIIIRAEQVDSSGPAYRIRLPQEQDVRALRGQQISVAA